MQHPSCEIVPLDRYNWELCLKIEIHESQRAFTPSILHSLAQAKFEALTPYGVVYQGEMIGFLMYGTFGGICWINRIIIDRQYQGKGLGSAALTLLLRKLRNYTDCKEIRTSYAEENRAAERLFSANGFVPMASALDDGEVVMRYEG